MPRIEQALLRTVPWLVGGLVAALPLLLVDSSSNLLTWFLVQLSALVLYGLGLTLALMTLADQSWFEAKGWSVSVRLIASGVSIVVLVTGTVGLVTLATSAAMRYDASTQFLQLLSALDIAWAGAAITIGAYRAWGRVWAVIGGTALGVFCVWSIWNYLNTVGFGPNGEWIVSGSDLMRLVIPYDMAAGVVAVIVFTYGVFRSTQAIEQASPQS
jgi:hypothetical protein